MNESAYAIDGCMYVCMSLCLYACMHVCLMCVTKCIVMNLQILQTSPVAEIYLLRVEIDLPSDVSSFVCLGLSAHLHVKPFKALGPTSDLLLRVLTVQYKCPLKNLSRQRIKFKFLSIGGVKYLSGAIKLELSDLMSTNQQ
jgi:hypothetical protein